MRGEEKISERAGEDEWGGKRRWVRGKEKMRERKKVSERGRGGAGREINWTGDRDGAKRKEKEWKLDHERFQTQGLKSGTGARGRKPSGLSQRNHRRVFVLLELNGWLIYSRPPQTSTHCQLMYPTTNLHTYYQPT